MNKKRVDELLRESLIGYMTTYAFIGGYRKLLCAWCKKNLYYAGDKRISKHLKQHE